VWHDSKLAALLVFGVFAAALPAPDELAGPPPPPDECVAPPEPGEPGVAAAPVPSAFAEFAAPPLCAGGGGAVMSAIAIQKQAMVTPIRKTIVKIRFTRFFPS